MKVLSFVTLMLISVTSYAQLTQEVRPLHEQRDSIYKSINNYREGLNLSTLKRSQWLQFWSKQYNRKAERRKAHSKSLRKGTAEIICFSGVDCLDSWIKSQNHNRILIAPNAYKIGIGISHGTVVARVRFKT